MDKNDSYEFIRDEEMNLLPRENVVTTPNYHDDYIIYESPDLATRNIVSYDTAKLLSTGFILPLRY
jgi:hypothetical protein